MSDNFVDTFLSSFIALFAVPIAAWVSWRLAKRKQDADTDSSIAEGANLAVETMMQAMGELKIQVDQLKTENKELRKQIGFLQLEIARLHNERSPHA